MELDELIPRGCDIRVVFETSKSVEKALQFKHEVVEVRALGSHKVGRHHSRERSRHSARHEDLYRRAPLFEAQKRMEEGYERKSLNSRGPYGSVSQSARDDWSMRESGSRKRQRSETPEQQPHQQWGRTHQQRSSFSRSPGPRYPGRPDLKPEGRPDLKPQGQSSFRSQDLPPSPPHLPAFSRSAGTRSRTREHEGSSRLKTPERAKYWSAEFAELSRKNAVKKEEDRKEAWKVQSRLLALVNKSPSCPREEEVVILDADEQPDLQRFREEAKKLDLLEHAKEKAEYAAILKKFNIVEVPASRPDCIDISDSD